MTWDPVLTDVGINVRARSPGASMVGAGSEILYVSRSPQKVGE